MKSMSFFAVALLAMAAVVSVGCSGAEDAMKKGEGAVKAGVEAGVDAAKKEMSKDADAGSESKDGSEAK